MGHKHSSSLSPDSAHFPPAAAREKADESAFSRSSGQGAVQVTGRRWRRLNAEKYTLIKICFCNQNEEVRNLDHEICPLESKGGEQPR